MSDWTHVAGIVVLGTYDFYSFNAKDLPTKEEAVQRVKEYIGPLSPFSAYNNGMKLPTGSEGPLSYDVHMNDSNRDAVIIVTIFGDLRDFSYPNQVVKWFFSTFNEEGLNAADIVPHIHSAVLTAENDYSGEQHSIVWKRGLNRYNIIG